MMTLLRTPPAPPAAPSAVAPRPAPRLLATLLVPLLATLAAVVGALGALDTPDPVPRSAPAGAFSAERARAHVAAVAQRPHPVGTAEHDRVREEILGRMRELGLSPRVQDGTGADIGDGAAMVGWARNVVATVPGTAPTGRLLVVAHYDSAETSHGAADDGIGVASALEIARALRAGPAPRNDVTFLVTDAEEPGLLGARAFVEAEQAAGRRDLPTAVLNLEARGTSGRAVMFETGPGNAPLVDALADRTPMATSLSAEIYRLLPNDTDFTVLRESGATGLNFAVLGSAAQYHTDQDSLAHLDPGSLQDLGATTLAATRRLAAADLAVTTQQAADSSYFTLGPLLVRYPAAVTLSAALLAAGALAAALRYARARTPLSLRGVARTAATLPLALAAAAAAATALWPLLTLVRPESAGLLLGIPYRTGPFVLAAALAALTATWVWAARLRRRVTALEAGAGAVLWLAAAALATAFLLPGAAYLFTWPALVGAVGLAAAARLPQLSPWRGPLCSAALVPAAALLTPVALLLLDTLPLALAAVPVALMVLGLAPAMAAAAGRTSARLRHLRPALTVCGTAAALAATGAGLLAAAPGAARPAHVSLLYTVDADTGRARWASAGTAGAGSGRLGHYVGTDGSRPRALEAAFPSLDEPAAWHTGPAPAAAVPLPEVRRVHEERHGDIRRIRLHITARHGRAAELALYADAGGAPVTAARTAGHRVPGGVNRPSAGDRWTWGLLLAAPPRGGATVEVEVRGDAPLKLRATAKIPGLPAGTLDVPRPAGVTWSGHDSGLTLASRAYTF